ncbi:MULTISPECIES: urease subunit beta [Pseudonocardia]|uniref:Urease subunit beta n=2 Tax=Pseudonocardia TaxID=1847 RepID=A0A1Y2N0A7_PSEAH|nr:MULTISPECIES: urease subunit beta [Pseudonocardia]OSY40731.1 Urease subunit alpha [Pseudonocardia autotrophica]TDN71962.1 urease subunit gamma/beta [Pseudonocardia autotrophica]BBG02649.1 urease subunit gamma/beta [Pseudonocardia autotrophica]GEC24708.1 urease subunit gamma/beta [Pseudonocardia saturnea]
MHLTPKDQDRLLLFLAAELARRRRQKGLRLTYPEARALIADEVVEAARGGAGVAEAAAVGASLLRADDLLPGVAPLIGTVQVEGFFEDGQKLVTIHDPIRPAASAGTDAGTATAKGDEEQAHVPGELLVEDGEIVLGEGRATAVVTVVNTGDRPVQVGSHFHFFEANRALRFNRREAFGMHLDIPSGTAVRFEPGEERDVALVAVGGTREIHGLNDMTNGPITAEPAPALLTALAEHGFLDTGATPA